MRKLSKKQADLRARAELDIQLKRNAEQLAEAHWELASELTTLAKATNDPAPLIQAVESLRNATRFYSFDTAPREHALIQQSIADTLLTLGRRTGDREALTTARDAYRGAITLASLLSDESLREDLRVNYKLTLTLLGDRPRSPSLFKVA